MRNLRNRWHSYCRKRTFKREVATIRQQALSLLLERRREFLDCPSAYAKKILGMKPFPYQTRLLEDQRKRIVACMGRQTGKTTTIAMKAIYFADTNQKVTILITSPSLRQSMIMFDRIATFVFSTSYLRSRVVRSTRTLIQFDNKSRIIALPCSANLLRGYSADMVICDEVAFMPEDVITQIVLPMLSTTDGHAIFLSTPWGKDHFFYRAFVNPAYSVHKVRSDECPLIKPEFLAEMRENMTKEAYMMEYEAEFVEALNSYFPQDLIRKCVESAQKLHVELYEGLEATLPSGDYYAGVDFGKLQDYSVIAVIKREGEVLKLVYMHQFPLETTYSQVVGHLVRANQKFQFRQVIADQTGVGEPVLEEIRNQGITRVQGLKFTVQVKEELLSNMKIAMEQDRLAIPYHRLLCQQVNEQQYAYSKSGHLRFSHVCNSHDDMLWSLALAVFAATKYPPSRGLIGFGSVGEKG